MMFEKIFQTDRLSKRRRVELTLARQPVDRVAILEQLSYNPAVIAAYTGKKIEGFDYGQEEICATIRQTLDLCMIPVPVRRADRMTTEDGFVIQYEHWNSHIESRPFHDEKGARDWLIEKTRRLRESAFDAGQCREAYARYMSGLQRQVGETVIMHFSYTGFLDVYTKMGLEIFSYFHEDYPEVMADFMRASVERERSRIHAVADRRLSPVILIGEEFAAKPGPLFPPRILEMHQYPHLKTLTEAWHEHGLAALFASGGNYKKVIPELIACGLDGFYGLEPACGMDIVELKNTYPHKTWAGGVDGVDLMERGAPQAVKTEVHRQIRQTNALLTGGLFVGSSSEINPSIRPENFTAMIEAAGDLPNTCFANQV